jgi:CubicO group peptidase (beta-lactamase class C family)
MKRWTSLCTAGVILTAWSAAAQTISLAQPESVGISSRRLERVNQGMQGLISRGDAAGIVTLIARGGKIVHFEAFGSQDAESKTPMKKDTIFRIASMTKPITSVAIMMLVEEGKISLLDPASKFIPAFREARVLVKGDGDTVRMDPVKQQITVRDLLSHRGGLVYGFGDAGPVGDAYRRAGISDGLTATEGTIAENVEKLARAPLVSQPGTEWHYSLGIDVLGRIVEVASAMPLDVFFRDRLFKPLGMVDTGFDVPEAKWSRFATAYSPDGTNGVRPMKDPETFGNTIMAPFTMYKAPKTYFSGGAGLVSTAADYIRFAQMLLNGGEFEGVRYLSPKTIELMTTSHTSDIPGGQGGLGTDFGLGFSVVTNLGDSQAIGSEGRYGWSGIYGTNFWVDPKEKLIGLVLVQRYPGSTVASTFQTLVYQAVVAPPVAIPLPPRPGMGPRRTTGTPERAPAPAARRPAAPAVVGR